MQFRAIHGARGFTYLELLFVVGVIGVAAAVSVPALNNALGRNRVFTSSELLAAQIREARLAAISRNTTFRVVFDCPDGAIRYLVVTGVPVTDEAVDRCTSRQPNDGLPVYLPSAVSLGDEPPSALEINGRGQISAVDGGPMPQSLSVTYGSFTRTLVVTATGRVASPAS
ncbi:MAG: hypothetical protein IT180_17895 [Acidobacteria bacterium]|nr:hypothetical protein [Acidobacteriota bacterium]